MKRTDKKVLVTGAAGFIGSHLVDRLLEENYRVTAIDNLSNGSLHNLRIAKENKQFSFIKVSVSDTKEIYRLVKDQQYDVIFHMAADNLLMSVADPFYDADVMVDGTLSILEAVRNFSPTTKIVFSSTGSVYGEPEYQPQDEKHPLNPVSPYGISKLAAEKYVLLWAKMYKIKTVALRYYNVYGPRQNYNDLGGVVGIFINRVMNEKPPVIEGTGHQERCFTYVDDVVRANIMAFENDQANDEAFNIGTTEITTINQLAQIIIAKFNKKLVPLYKPRRVGDIDQFRPDLSKAKKILGYLPKITLNQGITKTVNWFNTQIYGKK